MSNENKTPWYKKPLIVIPAVAVIFAAIVGAYLTFWLNPPPSDFSITINPMQGAVHQGGVIQTTVTIKGIHGYENSVTLSASDQPSGVVVAFTPPFGGATPAYTSNVMINVGTNVPADDYIIIIKGTGADGKEHSSTYSLTVKPITVTPTTPTTPTVTTTTTLDMSTYGFETSAQGWRPQTYADSQAIISVAQTTTKTKFGAGSLQSTVNLKAGHANYGKGEAWVDMQTSPPIGVTAPVDLTSATVSVWVYLPATAAGDPSRPNGIQLFFKDKSWKNKYSSWKNIGADLQTDQWSQITVNMATEPWAWDDGCDLTQVRAVGVKIGAGDGSVATFSGSIWIDAYNITPKKVINVPDAFFPSGWMGDWGDITFDDSWTGNPYSKPTSIKITYSAVRSQGEGWAGIYWQYSDKNWGDKPESRDLTGATKLTFYARGDKGGEKAEFKVGGITGKYPDSIQPAVSSGVIVLSDKWQQYTIDLKGKDLSHVIGGFVWVTNKNQNPLGSTIYLDDIKYE